MVSMSIVDPVKQAIDATAKKFGDEPTDANVMLDYAVRFALANAPKTGGRKVTVKGSGSGGKGTGRRANLQLTSALKAGTLPEGLVEAVGGVIFDISKIKGKATQTLLEDKYPDYDGQAFDSVVDAWASLPEEVKKSHFSASSCIWSALSEEQMKAVKAAFEAEEAVETVASAVPAAVPVAVPAGEKTRKKSGSNNFMTGFGAIKKATEFSELNEALCEWNPDLKAANVMVGSRQLWDMFGKEKTKEGEVIETYNKELSDEWSALDLSGNTDQRRQELVQAHADLVQRTVEYLVSHELQ